MCAIDVGEGPDLTAIVSLTERTAHALVVVLADDRLDRFGTRHRRFTPHQRRARAERPAGELPQRIEERGPDTMLRHDLVERLDVLLLCARSDVD